MPEALIVHGDNLALLPRVQGASVRLVYIDPPFNTGRPMTHTRLTTERAADGDRTGFGGRRYRTTRGSTLSYADEFDDYLAFLGPRLEEAHRVLADDGSLFVHLDCRESHYVKVALDQIFGRASFKNELVWAYDYGARSKSRWPAKHDSIFWYAKDPDRYVFRYDDIDRIPYLAPGLVGPEKAARGKTPTDVWWQTIVPTNGKERTGYPTQKPIAILERIVRVHSDPGDLVFDFFAGSGTTAEAALRHGRRALACDVSSDAVAVMTKRLAAYGPRVVTIDELGAAGWPGLA